jgi:hypothetical protein
MVFDVLYIVEPGSALQGAITTSVFDSRDALVAWNTQQFDLSNGRVPFFVRVSADVTGLGVWRVVLSCGECHLWDLPFEVRLAQSS